MMRLFVFLLIAFLFGSCSSASADREVIREDFARHFDEAGVSGTILVYDLEADRSYVHDAERASLPLIPASTFKIVHSLIALDSGVFADTSVVIEWDGQQRWVDAWNRDHSMTTAFRYSVVWYYQEMARRIGPERMQAYLRRIGYGNADIGGGIDRFWLTGDLRISAWEQVDLLVHLWQNDLPVSEEAMEAVKNLMIEEEGEAYVLRGKTGWAELDGPDVGWYVGYVEREGQTYFFALNIDMDSAEHAPVRKQIVRAALEDLGVL